MYQTILVRRRSMGALLPHYHRALGRRVTVRRTVLVVDRLRLPHRQATAPARRLLAIALVQLFRGEKLFALARVQRQEPVTYYGKVADLQRAKKLKEGRRDRVHQHNIER